MNLKRLRLMRTAARVERMHTMPGIHRQTVGEHTFGMLAILFEIEPSPELVLLSAFLYHDAAEAVTGDVPAPTKWRHRGLKQQLDHVETSVEMEFDMLHTLSVPNKKILKFCDTLELAMYSAEEAQMGNIKAAVVMRNCMSFIVDNSLQDCCGTPSKELFMDIQNYMYAQFDPYLGSDILNGWPDYKTVQE